MMPYYTAEQTEKIMMNKEELSKLQAAAEVLDDHGREILAEQLWYVFEAEGGERE